MWYADAIRYNALSIPPGNANTEYVFSIREIVFFHFFIFDVT